MTADTTLLRADNGAPISFRQLMDDGHDGISVWSLDSERRMVAAPITAVFASGVKDVYELVTTSGRRVKASGNHKFMTWGGWVRLDSLKVGDRIATPRAVPAPVNVGLGWSENRLGLLAHLIGDGCVVRSQPVHYTSDDAANHEFVATAAAAEFGITPRVQRTPGVAWWNTYLPAPHRCTHGKYNPLHVWLRSLGIEDLRSGQKRIPDAMFAASDAEIETFLRHLWATDGSIWFYCGSWRFYYTSTSRQLVDGVAVLLARLGIIARIKRVRNQRGNAWWTLHVNGVTAQRVFAARVGAYGRRGDMARRFLAETEHVISNTNVDTLPVTAWGTARLARVEAGLTERQFQAGLGMSYCGSTLYRSCMSRARAARVAAVLGSRELESAAGDDVFWDGIAAIEHLGPMPVFDATVAGTHNFVADGVVAHNSLEQDADVVVLLHRPRDSNTGEMIDDLSMIVAKNRHGRTGRVEFVFDGAHSLVLERPSLWRP